MNIQTLRRMAAQIPHDIERKELQTPEAKLEAEIKSIKGQILDAIKAKADLEVVKVMQSQLDALDCKIAERHSSGDSQPDLRKVLSENEQVARLLHDKKGVAYLEFPSSMLDRKTLIDSDTVGRSTSGVLAIDRTPGIVTEARQALRMRQVLSARPTSLGIIDFLKVNSGPSPASMQVESSAKAENAVTFTSVSEQVKTVATLLPCSRQVLDDMTELMGYLQNMLPYEVDLREELEILHGGGSGADLHGIIPQASAFSSALLSLTPGWNKSDIVSAAIQQIQIAKEVEPTFVVLHPTDYWQIRRTKNSQLSYLFAGGNSIDPFWGLQPVITTSMGSGNFLVGSGSPVACEIRDRMTTQLEISTQHSDFFAANKIMIRAERRLALCVYRPASYIFGTLTSSPA